MGKSKRHNKGFSLIELLIAITILSIVMIMVVQFMSTSSVAYRKQKKNLNIQTEAMTVLENISDTLMQASYVRIKSMDGKMYTVTKDASNKRIVTEDTSKGTVDYDFVPDNYANYSQIRAYSVSATTASDRKVIVNFDTFEIVDDNGNPYPMSYDKDVDGGAVRSFRALRTSNIYSYVMPKYIYAEYASKKDDGSEVMVHVVYGLSDTPDPKTGTRSVYMYRYETDDWTNRMALGYAHACLQVDAMMGSSGDGFLSDNVVDFYISADTEGNALLTNILFEDDGYEYNTVETIKFRNSNVLTVRPQKLFKVKGTGVATTQAPSAGSSGNAGESGNTTP